MCEENSSWRLAHHLQQAKEHAEKYNANSSHLLIAGGSAGGCLAMQVINEFITRGSPSVIKGAILFFAFCSPMPYNGPYPAEHKSMTENGTGAPFLTTDVLLGMWSKSSLPTSPDCSFPFRLVTDV